jgi:uncharacterized protein YbjT (DUF2867 family)
MHTVLVTGANGFIGKAVCTHLADCGWLVRAVVRDSTKASHVPAPAHWLYEWTGHGGWVRRHIGR